MLQLASDLIRNYDANDFAYDGWPSGILCRLYATGTSLLAAAWKPIYGFRKWPIKLEGLQISSYRSFKRLGNSITVHRNTNMPYDASRR